jgi:hypothetical protein
MTFSSMGQDVSHSSNVILMIDDKLCLGSVVDIHLVDGNGERIDLEYIPGKLSMEKGSYEHLIQSDLDSATLFFDYYIYKKDKQALYSYKIPFYSNWLDLEYLVLKIYNLDNKKYQKVFKPLDESRNYTFELEYPGGSMRRVEK